MSISANRQRNLKLAGVTAVMFAAGMGTVAVRNTLDIGDFFRLLASVGGMGIVSSVLLTLIRVLIPSINNEYASLASIFMAVVISMSAQAVLPFVDNITAAVGQYWPMVVWLAQQLWYFLVKPDTMVVDE